jgi:hypothetical protein
MILKGFGFVAFNIRHRREIQVRECLLSFGADYFVFQFAIQKFKN